MTSLYAPATVPGWTFTDVPDDEPTMVAPEVLSDKVQTKVGVVASVVTVYAVGKPAQATGGPEIEHEAKFAVKPLIAIGLGLLTCLTSEVELGSSFCAKAST